MAELYHYLHCPFCVRVRMAAGFLNIPFISKPLPYEDEATPVRLTGKKMLPIWVNKEGKAINESLDIILSLDIENRLGIKDYNGSKEEKLMSDLLNRIGSEVHNMAMPYWIYTKEFSDSSRKYFQSKKEEKRGPFSDLVAKREGFEKNLLKILSEEESNLKTFYKSDQISILDIVLAAHLWGMYIVPEFQFPEKWHQYLMRVKLACKFDYMGELWR